jgi:hypothetical protein
MGQTGNSGGGSSPSGDGGSWWSRMSRSEQIVGAVAAAIVVGTFGVVAALIGHSSGSSQARPSGSGPPVVTSSSPATSATKPMTTPDYYLQPTPVVISGNGPDFDTKPLGPGPGPASFSYNTFSLATGGSGTPGFGFAVWTKGGTPTASDCKTWVSTHLVDGVYAPTAGMKICFGTDQGRIGLLVVQPGTSEDQFKAIASVWGS